MFTGYFANLKKYQGLIPIAICQFLPKYIGNILSYKKVAPPAHLVLECKNNGINRKQYIQTYSEEVLNHLDANKVLDDLRSLSGNHLSEIILLCYEKPGDLCHRHLFADWLRSKKGIEISEFQNNPKKEQFSLFS